MKKKTTKSTADADLSLEALADRAIRAFVAKAEARIAADRGTPPLLQALLSLRRQERQGDGGGDPADLDRRVRELEPRERLGLLREWNQIDVKKSGLA